MGAIHAVLAAMKPASGGTGIDPDTLSNRIFTLETPISGATNGAIFTTWPDSLALNGFTQGDSARKLSYATNVVNGYDVVTHPGTARMMVTSTSLAAGTIPRTFIAVIKAAHGGSSKTLLSGQGYGSLQLGVYSTGELFFGKQSVTYVNSVSQIPNDAWCVVAYRYATTVAKFWINGVDATGGGNWGTSLNAAVMNLGASRDYGSPWLGSIAEIRGFDASHSDSDIEGAMTFLMNKYAL